MADTIKIAVCDDEKNIRYYLVSLIKKQDIECSISEYASAGEYLAEGREHDLLFLDIEMGGSGTEMDGMRLPRNRVPCQGLSRNMGLVLKICETWQRGISEGEHKGERGCFPCDSNAAAGGGGKAGAGEKTAAGNAE